MLGVRGRVPTRPRAAPGPGPGPGANPGYPPTWRCRSTRRREGLVGAFSESEYYEMHVDGLVPQLANC